MSSITRILGDILAASVEDAAKIAGPPLRRRLTDMALAAVFLLAAMVFLVGAAGIALGGAYLLLAPEIGQVGAAFLCAAFSVAVGLMLIVWAKSKISVR